MGVTKKIQPVLLANLEKIHFKCFFKIHFYILYVFSKEVWNFETALKLRSFCHQRRSFSSFRFRICSLPKISAHFRYMRGNGSSRPLKWLKKIMKFILWFANYLSMLIMRLCNKYEINRSIIGHENGTFYTAATVRRAFHWGWRKRQYV